MADFTAEEYDTLEPIIGEVSSYSLAWQVDVFNFTPDTDGEWVKIDDVRRSILKYMNEGPTLTCPECKGTGQRDTGGVYPWGEGIFVECDCESPLNTHKSEPKA